VPNRASERNRTAAAFNPLVETAHRTPLPLLPAAPLGAAGAFSYEYKRCLRCCTGKRIRVNPYEVFRLARHLGTSTTDFLARYTIEGGTELARTGDERCVLLGESGCSVHPDRPLVCRLYPLGRHVKGGEPDRYVEEAIQAHCAALEEWSRAITSSTGDRS
jgi:Fe-S-cluster containining protein